MIKLSLPFVFLFITIVVWSQPKIIISTKKEYAKTVAANSKKQLLNLKLTIPSILINLRYNSTNNFTKTKLYKNAQTTYLRKEPAKALLEIQNILKEKGYGLKIFDAYRPYAATKLMWELIQDDRYVANPKNGSNHNRGLAVDITLIQLNTGTALNMGTGFDNFTDTAHHSFMALPATVLANRTLLKSTMELYGFKSFDTEWWHYSWPNNQDYEVLDLSFKKLKKMIK
jgi:zinc D-Ala-D-Ala dipeptidase